FAKRRNSHSRWTKHLWQGDLAFLNDRSCEIVWGSPTDQNANQDGFRVKRRTVNIVAAMAMAVVCAAFPALAVSQAATEDQLMAAYVFNFAKFVEWPAELFPAGNSAMNFCAL